MRMNANRECLNPGCKRDIYARGLCVACYGIACRLVREHKTKWETLEKAGHALKSSKSGRHNSQRTVWLMTGKTK